MSVKGNPLGPHDDLMIIKKKGVMDLEQAYSNTYQWFLQHGYEINTMDHKAKTPSAMGTEEEMVIKAWRNEDDFIRFALMVRFDFWDASPVKVIRNGVPKKMMRCRLRVLFLPNIVFDYEDRFEKTKLLRSIRQFYIGNIIKRKYQIQGDKFEYEFHELHDLIKRSLEMDMHGDQYDHNWK